MSGHASCYTHRQYYLTCDEFNALWEYAKERCQVCRTPSAETPRGTLVLDHAHDYGNQAVRGLLCDFCNVRMGRIDRRAEPHDSHTRRYCLNAWFTRHAMSSRGFWVNRLLQRWEWPGSKSYRIEEAS